MKHIIFFNTKGGVSKSTLCEFASRELLRLGRSVNVDNTDQQVHVTLIETENSDVCLYDTAGAFTESNMDLLRAASQEDVLIIIPLLTGKNDFKELPFLTEKLKSLNLINRSKFVFTNVRKNSKSLIERRKQIIEMGFDVMKWTMPTLEAFREQMNTVRTRNEISAFLYEIKL